MILPLWPNTVCKDGPTPVGHHSARRWRSGVGTRSTAVRRPVADVISRHGVKYHQYFADDTQLYLSMHADNTTEILAACTADVRQWYMQNGLQLNPDK